MVGMVADALTSRCTQLVAAHDDVEAMAELDGWTGDASVAASKRGNSLISTLEQTVAEVSAVRRAADEVQVAAERLTAFTFETDALARAHGLAISDDGAVTPLPAMGPPPPPDVVATRARVQVEVADRVGQILRRAGDVDADFAAVMTRAPRGDITEQGVGTLAQAADVGAAQSGLSIIGPPEGGTPEQTKAWWDSQSDTAKGAILRDNPDLVRNLDGIPVTDRDTANRTVPAHEIGRLRGDTSEQGQLELRGLLDIDKRLDHAEPG